MGKAFVFAAGIITGAVSVPVAVVYVRPVQKGFVRILVSIYTFAIEQEGSDFREKIIAVRDHIDQFLEDHPEEKS